MPDILAGGASPLDTDDPTNSTTTVGLFFAPWGNECGTLEDVKVFGEVPGDHFGWSTSFVGNLELAGTPTAEELLDDFVVGAPRGPKIGLDYTNQGRVYVFLSGLFGTTSGHKSAADASLIIEDLVAKHRFGYAVCPAGDFDDDGYPDFAVGAPGMFEDPLAFGGEVFVISGALVRQKAVDFDLGVGPQLVFIDDVICRWPNGSPIQWTGDQPGDKLGVDVAFAGNLGPNAADQGNLVAGAPQWTFDVGGNPDYPTTGNGYIKLFSPLPGSSPVKISYLQAEPLGAPDQPIGPDGGAWFGQSVAGGLDLDGDGNGEVVVGAPMWDFLDSSGDLENTGKSYVIEPTPPVLPLITYRTDEGLNAQELFGWSVAAIGDFDGDSVVDFAVGSRSYGVDLQFGACTPCGGGDADSGGRGAGSATVFTDGGSSSVRYTGENIRDSFGWSMVCVGDVDGDSKDEFVACSFRWGADGLDKEEGRIYLIEE